MNRTQFAKFAFMLGFGMFALAGAGRGEDSVKSELPDGRGKEQVMTACAACHAITQVTAEVHTSSQWADVVDQMISRGAPVSEEDYPVIVEYLSTHFGPRAETPAAGQAPAALSPKAG